MSKSFDLSSIIGLKQWLTLTELAKNLEVHCATPGRWRLTGVRGRKLACFRRGGRWCTSRESIADFFCISDAPPIPPSTRNAVAQAKLEAFGISKKYDKSPDDKRKKA